ncbi:MAG: hypothetical protein JKP96_11455 [Oceanicaulis sp.]|jgi:hypothetical protein|nr:hypothetical protein [Oceanicaulis sp.]
MADAYQQLGLTGIDREHIQVRMLKTVKEEGGKVVETYIPSFTHGAGDLRTSNAKEYFFALINNDGSLSNDFEFERFDAWGKSWDGIMVDEACGYEVTYLRKDERRCVRLFTTCRENLFQQKYTIVVRQISTGEIYVLDPGTSDDDRPGNSSIPPGP